MTDRVHLSVDDAWYEVPAGGLSPDMTPEEVAHRGLLEEVGGTAGKLRHVGQFYTSNGISNEEGEITDGPSALALLWCEPLLI